MSHFININYINYNNSKINLRHQIFENSDDIKFSTFIGVCKQSLHIGRYILFCSHFNINLARAKKKKNTTDMTHFLYKMYYACRQNIL